MKSNNDYLKEFDEKFKDKVIRYAYEQNIDPISDMQSFLLQALTERTNAIIEAIPDGDWEKLTPIGIMPIHKNFTTFKSQLKSQFKE